VDKWIMEKKMPNNFFPFSLFPLLVSFPPSTFLICIQIQKPHYGCQTEARFRRRGLRPPAHHKSRSPHAHISLQTNNHS
jgi:hypothetical protein